MSVIKWKLKEYLEQEGKKPYDLTRHVRDIPYPSVYRLVNGEMKSVKFDVLDDLLNGLCELTGKEVGFNDIMEFERDLERAA